MGSYSVKGQFEFTENQQEILTRFGVTYHTEWVPEKEKNGRKAFAHHLTTFEWEGQKAPIPNSVLCYEEDESSQLIPRVLGHSERKSERMSLTTHGLSGSKD
jgi:hypothetical protein